jgi:hypothetical protein
VVRTSTRTLLAGIGAGGALAAGAVTLVLTTGAPANAAPTTSTAYGVSATGPDGVAPTPSVASSGAITTKSGSAAGAAGTFKASGITVRAGAGYAEATVGSLTVGGVSIGRASATCKNGVISYDSPPARSTGKLRVLPRTDGAAAVVQILGAGDKPSETIKLAVVTCGTGTPPTDEPTQQPTGQPTQQPPTGQPTHQPSGKPSHQPTHTPAHRPGQTPDTPAPAPVPHLGHHPVTG